MLKLRCTKLATKIQAPDKHTLNRVISWGQCHNDSGQDLINVRHGLIEGIPGITPGV